MDSSIASPSFRESVRLHVDTEFTDFVKCDLISIGVAADYGPTFYAENKSYQQAWASDFVKAEILPMLDMGKYGQSRSELAARLWTWIDELPCNHVIVTVDYPTDWTLLLDLFGRTPHPKMKPAEYLFANLSNWAKAFVQSSGSFHEHDYVAMYNRLNKVYFEGYQKHFEDPSQIRHHALADAMANRAGYNLVIQEFGMPL